jgi:hypothetical protein
LCASARWQEADMGQLLNLGLWQSGLDSHHEVLTALAHSMQSVNFDLEIVHRFDDGRSDRPVALVLRVGKGHPEQLVLKFCEPGTRTAALTVRPSQPSSTPTP